MTTPTTDNKQMYNGGSEWQNDFGNLPDLQQTFYRNYDTALGRWIAVDPVVESAESMTVYQYAGNNPIMLNDPLGDKVLPPGEEPIPNYYKGPHHSLFGSGIPSDILSLGEAPLATGGNSSTWNSILANTGYYVLPNGQVVLQGGAKATGTIYTFGTDGKLYSAVSNGEYYNEYEQFVASANGGFREKLSAKAGLALLNQPLESIHVDVPNLDNANKEKIDKAGAWDAGINILGGVAELILGGEANPAQAVDGVGRILFNTIRLGAYLTGHKEFGDAVPTNLGGLVGKIIDGSNDFNKVGEWQKGLTAANDYATFIFTLGNGGAWESLISQKSSFLIRSTSVVGIAVNYYTFWSDSQPYKK